MVSTMFDYPIVSPWVESDKMLKTILESVAAIFSNYEIEALQQFATMQMKYLSYHSQYVKPFWFPFYNIPIADLPLTPYSTWQYEFQCT